MELTEGQISRHYFVCPYCHEATADLYTHSCKNCGATVVSILWTKPQLPMTPELVMIGRNY